jgi:hypothetical protein
MNPSSLDTQSGSTQDDHLARIVRLETNMDNVTSVLVNLQRTQEQHFQYTLTRLDDLRDRIDQVYVNAQEQSNLLQDRIDKAHIDTQGQISRLQDSTQGQISRLQDNMQGQINRLQDRIDQVHLHTLERIERLQDRIDRNTRWLVGLMLANITAVAGLYVRMLLA